MLMGVIHKFVDDIFTNWFLIFCLGTGCMNLKNDRVYDKNSPLSKGEMTEATLVKILSTDFIKLVLDESANHLELQVREAFENALLDYSGTVFLDSHDNRYFLERVTTEILDLDTGEYLKGSYVEY